jgi:Flp pilus assembly protein TadG
MDVLCNRSERGQAVVELTLCFVLFLMIFFALVEFTHLFYTRLTMQHSLRTAARYMVTGRSAQDADGNQLPRPEVIRNVFCANLIGTGLTCPPLGPSFSFTCDGVPCSTGGGPEQTVTITVVMTKPAMTPFFAQFFTAGGVPFTIGATMRTEPFGTAS